MTYKSYIKLIESYKSDILVEIQYETKHSCGVIKLTAPFFLEKYKKIVRLLKNVKINDTSVYKCNHSTNVEIYMLHTLCSLEQIKSFLERLGNLHESN